MAALQPYKSSCPWTTTMECNFFQLFSFLIKTKVVQNVNRMSERQTDRQTDGQKDRKTERLFSLGVKTKVVQNVNRMSER